MRHLTYTAVFLAPVVILLTLIWHATDGHFTYTLDDPYIHMALAKQIWNGHFGINPEEFSAPSSSLLWPLILAPFASFEHLFEWMPLVINSLCVVASGLLWLAILDDKRRWIGAGMTLCVLYATNAYGLVFTGMEHSLQVLLVLLIVYCMLYPDKWLVSTRLAAIFYLALIMLPLIRYEGLAISLPVLAYLFAQGEKRNALLAGSILLLLLTGFSLFLYHLGLGVLPSSIIAKSAHGSLDSLALNVNANIMLYGYLLPPIAVMYLSLSNRNPTLALVLISVTLLHFVFGRHGWFGRYEVYFVTFILAIGLHMLFSSNPSFRGAALLLPLAFPQLTFPTNHTHQAAANIYYQQGQMAELSVLLNDKVAVNDLGLVALRTQHYVLDLWGLGSREALTLRLSADRDPAWMETLMQKHDVHYALIYDGWFSFKPDNWIKVGELSLQLPLITPADKTVALYANTPAAAEKLSTMLKTFANRQVSRKFAVKILGES